MQFYSLSLFQEVESNQNTIKFISDQTSSENLVATASHTHGLLLGMDQK